MWFNQLSNSNSTPSPPASNRSYSPAAPRRPTGLASSTAQRPSFQTRSSSLSLGSISNDSTTSLLTRRPNGSALKQSATPPNAADPLEVLEKLLGSEGKELPDTKSGTNGVHAEDDEQELELDFGGLTLQELALADIPTVDADPVYSTQTIEDCMYPHISPCLYKY